MSPTLIGQPITRLDGGLKVTGTATYAAEFQRPKLAYGALIQSEIATVALLRSTCRPRNPRRALSVFSPVKMRRVSNHIQTI